MAIAESEGQGGEGFGRLDSRSRSAVGVSGVGVQSGAGATERRAEQGGGTCTAISWPVASLEDRRRKLPSNDGASGTAAPVMGYTKRIPIAGLRIACCPCGQNGSGCIHLSRSRTNSGCCLSERGSDLKSRMCDPQVRFRERPGDASPRAYSTGAAAELPERGDYIALLGERSERETFPPIFTRRHGLQVFHDPAA
jgi:hypothetical protein